MEPLDLELERSSGTASRSMETFARYESDYHQCSRAINQGINGILARHDQGDRDAVAAGLAEAEQYVKGMEVEARSMKGRQKQRCQPKAQQCRTDLQSLRRTAQQAIHRADAGELMQGGAGGAGGAPLGGINSGQGFLQGRSERLVAARESLDRSHASLLDSQQVLSETEAIGQGVVGDLESQRESLLRSRTNIRETAGFASGAREALGSIARRESRHRLCLYAIILALSSIILVLLYFKIRRWVA